MRDFLWLRERIQVVHDEALTPQAIAVQEAEEMVVSRWKVN